jgi:hypothetical protein
MLLYGDMKILKKLLNRKRLNLYSTSARTYALEIEEEFIRKTLKK